MKKDNLQLVIDDLNRKGIQFTTHTAMLEKLMKNPEFRKLHEADQSDARKGSTEGKIGFQMKAA